MITRCIGITFALGLLTSGPGAAQSSSADSAWARGDRTSAKQLYMQRVRAEPSDARALFRLALLSGWEQHHDESIRWLDRLLSIQPGDRDARVARARSLAAIGRFDEAKALVDSILESHPGEVSALQARARFLVWDGLAGRAEALWRQALALDPGNVESLTGLAQNLRWQGRTGDAMQVIRPARAADPSNVDVHEQYDWIAQAYRPRLRSIVTRESDSDRNDVTTVVVGASARATPVAELRAIGWQRMAGLDTGAGRDAVARGGTMTLAIEMPAGWSIEAGAGASTSDLTGAPARTALNAAIATPRRGHASALLAVSRTPWDYTVPLVENGVVVDEAMAQLDVRASRSWAISANASVARFDVSRSATDSRKLSARLAVTRRISDPFFIVAGARMFGFDEDVNGGFFDPDFYGIADIALAWRREGRHVTLEADAAPGMQQIGSDGDVTGALRAAATITLALRPGRSISLRGVWANTGLQPVSADAGSAYRYHGITIGTNWWF